MSDFVVICPHCEVPVLIAEINCGIFRHGFLNGQQIPPHASKQECEAYIQAGALGCCKPFKIVMLKAVICEYI
jgi:hypothetical protein